MTCPCCGGAVQRLAGADGHLVAIVVPTVGGYAQRGVRPVERPGGAVLACSACEWAQAADLHTAALFLPAAAERTCIR